MNNIFLAVLIFEGAMILVMLGVIFWLIRVQRRLKQDYQILKEIVHGNSNDISGLCAAALTVDNRIASTDRYINDVAADLVAKIEEMEQHQEPDHPYSGDIRKVRSGASVNELMRNSGLSHDEAALLIRLHGSKPQS